MTNATSCLIGVIVTGICAGIPYWFASRQLASEAKKLHKLSTLILTALEDSHLARLNRDSKGEITGLTITASSTIAGHARIVANLQTVSSESPRDEQRS